MTEDFKSRLRRLRREEPSAGAVDDAADPLPLWFRARSPRSHPDHPVLAASDRTLGLPEDLGEERSTLGAFAARRRVFALDHRHGDWSLVEVDAASPEHLALCARDRAISALRPRRAVYLDIETTGLSGGAGVHPFLVGLGWFDEDAFTLWQGFAREPAEEGPMLAAVAELVAARDGLVSFFGKSFDRHRLEDKMRIFGIEPPFAGRPHLDLYHVCHRLYRSAFEDGRLQTMERALCGKERDDDLPGAFAPAAWFDFLAGRPHRLEGVFRHNADDILSLVTLTAHVGRALEETRADGRALGGPGATRAAGLARVLAADEPAHALAWLERALERRTARGAAAPIEWLALVPDLAQKAGIPLRALEACRALLAELGATREHDPRARTAWIQIAKLCEHTFKDRARALAATLAAERLARAARASATEHAELARRRARLTAKLRTAAGSRGADDAG